MIDGGLVSSRTLRGVGVGTAVVHVVLVAVTAALVIATDGRAANQYEQPWVEVASAVLTLGSVAGLLIVWSRPRNLVGWVLLLPGTVQAFEDAAVAAVNTTHVVLGTPVLATEVLAVVSDALWLPSTGVGVVGLFLLFPDGRPIGRHGRWTLRVVLTAAGAFAAGVLLADAPLYALDSVDNPLGIADSTWLDPVIGVATIVVFLCGLVAIGSLVARWRRADVVQRAQLKWFLAAAVLVVVSVVVTSLVAEPSGTAGSAWALLPDVAMVGVAAAIVVAVRRHRLYEIDRVVSRTVTYAVVTALLLGVYAGLVVVLQATVAPLGADSDLAVATSTLAVAALFHPVRRRVSRMVDRRFDRAAYDSERIITAFAHRVRDQVELDDVADELRSTAASAVQPAVASVWIPDGRGRSG